MNNRLTEYTDYNDATLAPGAGSSWAVASHRMISDCRYYRACILVLACALALAVPRSATAQSNAELNTLFFDPVYPVSEDQPMLLSSGQRQGINQGGNGEGNEEGSEEGSEEKSANNLNLPPAETDIDAAQVLSGISDYEASIAAHIGNGGSFDPALAQDYLSIGSLYQQAGSYADAKAAFESAMHIQRVNQGLFTLDQTEAVKMLIESSNAAREFGEADKYHEYLYYLQSRSLGPEDDGLIAATMDWADWNLEAFRRSVFQNESGLQVSTNMGNAAATQFRNNELVAIQDDMFSEVLFVPRSALLFVNPRANQAITSRQNLRAQAFRAEQIIDPRLRNAEDLYEKVLEQDSKNAQALHKKATIVFLFKTQLKEIIDSSVAGSAYSSSSNRTVRTISALRRGYSDNREAFLELAQTLEAGDDPEAAANAYINLGDWDLTFDRFNPAMESYNRAREILVATGYNEAEITQYLTPEPAIFVPGFAPHRYTRSFQDIPEDADIPYIGYFDVTFNKRRRGDLRSISITDSSDNASALVRRRLMDMLRDVQARPKIVTGQAEEQADIKVRYYYSY